MIGFFEIYSGIDYDFREVRGQKIPVRSMLLVDQIQELAIYIPES